MASLRFLLGLIPATSKYESQSDDLRSNYRDFKNFEVSEELKHFLELEKEVNSPDFAKNIKAIQSQKFKYTEEYKKELEYNRLRKSKAVKAYLKNKDSAKAQELAETSDVKNFLELEKFVNSEKFAEVKKYMALSGKEKLHQSEEYQRQQEFFKLVKSEKILWHKKIKKKYPFSWVERWDLSFEDLFDSGKVDTKTWMSRYINGDRLLNKAYVQVDDKHAFTDGKNLEIIDKKLRILTRREKGTCLVWDNQRGFYDKDFDFTSDLISTGKSFSQAYGLIEAKIKFGDSGVTQAFSLMSEKLLPHVDIVKFEKGKIFAANFWNKGSEIGKSVSSSRGGKYTRDYYIYSILWEAGKITWKINGVEFKVQGSGVSDEALFLVFNSSLKDKAKDKGIPSAFEIDWVRVYKGK